MTRIPLLDPHAQAVSRITGQGYILVPAPPAPDRTEIVETMDTRRGRFIPLRAGGLDGGALWSPFPDDGGAFFVGEAWSPFPGSHFDPAHPMYIPPRWRAAGEAKTGGRWQPARTLPPHMARTRFRVLSRSALKLGEVTEDMAAGMGFENRANAGFYATPHRNGVRHPQILDTWWPLWTRTAYNPQSWAFLAHVERI